MSRYVNQIKCPIAPAGLAQPIADYLTKEGFGLVNYKGSQVWKKGMGILTGPQYICVSYGADFIQIEAFIKNALLPGVYFGEIGIDGFYGAIPKSLLKQRVTTIEQYIYSLWQPQMPQQ